MGKYLKLFENHTEYENASQNLILPNVSLCVAENEVHYNPFVDPYNGHPYVEIGGLKWATMNVGATSETDYGLYFQWGDTQGYTADQVGSGEGQKYFGWADYKYGDGTSTTEMTKYNSTDGLTTLEAVDDAAVANWGGSWRMPTTAEFQALGAAVNTVWTNDYQSTGIKGIICTAKDGSGAQLFFPAAGGCYDGSVGGVGDGGCCWSSSLDTRDRQYAYGLSFDSDGAYWVSDFHRYYGYSVRPVVG